MTFYKFSVTEWIMFREIGDERAFDGILNQIIENIQNGSLKAGAALPAERTMAETMGVSRPAVREVLRALELLYGKDIRYCSNRKEVKDHGDKGILLGSPIEDGDKVVIIEDVTTAGTSIQETLPIIKAQGDVSPIGLVVSVDRMERGQGTKSALKEIEEKYGLKTTAIVTMAEVVEHLYNKEYKGKVIIDDTLKAAIDAYYEQYGAE